MVEGMAETRGATTGCAAWLRERVVGNSILVRQRSGGFDPAHDSAGRPRGHPRAGRLRESAVRLRQGEGVRDADPACAQERWPKTRTRARHGPRLTAQVSSRRRHRGRSRSSLRRSWLPPGARSVRRPSTPTLPCRSLPLPPRTRRQTRRQLARRLHTDASQLPKSAREGNRTLTPRGGGT
jgi:hypothetical protein